MPEPLDILLLPAGSAGDVHPFIPIGQELARRGHRVTVLANPYFQERLAEADLAVRPLGTAEEFVEFSRNPDIWDPWKGFKLVFGEAVARMGECHHAIMEWATDAERPVMAAAALALAARVANEKHGIPLATVQLQPVTLRSAYEVPVVPGMPLPPRLPRWVLRAMYWWLDRFQVDPVVREGVNAFRGELGLPPVRRLLKEWWNSPELIIGLWPAWFGPPLPDWPDQLRLTGFIRYAAGQEGIDPRLEKFLSAGEPPVVVAPGSILRPEREYFESTVAGARRLGRRVIIVTIHEDRLPAGMGDDVVHFRYVPYDDLFGRAAAVIHHGGIGTSAQAMAAGVPQLVTPFAHDQPDNARRLERLGVARQLKPQRLSPARVERALRGLLDSPDSAAACNRVAERFVVAAPASEASDLVERLGRREALSRPAAALT